MMPLSQAPYAVIDIGSNSVRMVVYHALARVPMPLFNEKYYCALAEDLQSSGALSPAGTQQAHQALARFKLMLERFKVSDTQVIATSAIRDASDGKQFVADVKARYGLSIDIISGMREAELAGLGILASMHEPEGLCADLGGGSLELAQIKGGRITHTHTLPLGALRLMARFDSPDDAMRVYLRKQLEGIAWLRNISTPHCYAIGGGFRSIAKMYQRQVQTPLKLLHEYRIKADTLLHISREVSTLRSDQLRQRPGVSEKRAASLPYAASLLSEIMQASSCETVCFSVAGIREGLMYDALDASGKQHDPLIASAQVLSRIAGRKGRYSAELFEWMAPIFTRDGARQQRLREALCWISEIAWTIDPNFRAEWAYLRVLQSDIKGLSHEERIMLALALYHRYQVRLKKEYSELVLLSESQRVWAQMLGIASNLAFQLSGGQIGNLHHTQLHITHNGTVDLHFDDAAKPLYTDVVAKRLAGLSTAFKAL